MNKLANLHSRLASPLGTGGLPFRKSFWLVGHRGVLFLGAPFTHLGALGNAWFCVFSLFGTVRAYCAAYPSSRALQLPVSSAAGSDVIHCLFGHFLTKGRRDHLIRARWFGEIISLQPCCRMDDGRLLIFTFHILKLSK